MRGGGEGGELGKGRMQGRGRGDAPIGKRLHSPLLLGNIRFRRLCAARTTGAHALYPFRRHSAGAEAACWCCSGCPAQEGGSGGLHC